MTKWIDNEYMYKLRKSGVTYQEIAEDFGISRQSAYERIKGYERKLLGLRGRRFNINTIIYKGIYEYFKDNPSENISTFTEKVMGFTQAYVPKIRDYITGYHEPRFSVKQLKTMCAVTGKTFEELFELREGARE